MVQRIDVKSIEANHALLNLVQVPIAVDHDLDVSTYDHRELEVFSLWLLVVVFEADALFERSVELEVVDCQFFLDGVPVDRVKLVVAALAENLLKNGSTSQIGTNKCEGSISRDSSILTGGLSMLIFW